MGQQIPESWVQFEKIITGLVDKGIIYAKVQEVHKNWQCGCRHGSVDLSVPTNLPPLVWVPSTPSMLFSFIVKICAIFVLRENENKQKEAGFGPFKKLTKDAHDEGGVIIFGQLLSDLGMVLCHKYSWILLTHGLYSKQRWTTESAQVISGCVTKSWFIAVWPDKNRQMSIKVAQ